VGAVLTVLKLAAAAPFVTAWGAAAFSFVVAVNYTSTVNLGAIIITISVGMMTLVGLLFGVRYRENNKLLMSERNAQEERGNRLQAELNDHRANHEEYREKKHAIINELNGRRLALQAELELERSKHDYTQVVTQVAQLTQQQQQTTDVLAKLVTTVDILVDKAKGQPEPTGKP
jgi:hypothetical protein